MGMPIRFDIDLYSTKQKHRWIWIYISTVFGSFVFCNQCMRRMSKMNSDCPRCRQMRKCQIYGIKLQRKLEAMMLSSFHGLLVVRFYESVWHNFSFFFSLRHISYQYKRECFGMCLHSKSNCNSSYWKRQPKGLKTNHFTVYSRKWVPCAHWKKTYLLRV